MNTYGPKTPWGKIHMEDFKRFNCLPDSCIEKYYEQHQTKLQQALQPFYMALEIAGRSIPIMVGISFDREIVYWWELRNGFAPIQVKPVSYWLFWDRYKIKHYFGAKKDKLYTLDEVVQEFVEIYGQLGDQTLLK